MHKVVFTGPTLSHQEILEKYSDHNILLLKQKDDLPGILMKDFPLSECCTIVAPPIAGGDLYKLKSCNAHFVVAIIDGYFENTTAVWHKEILYLMSRGINVYGAASMGALRAAELYPFGMIGIGEIYRDYVNHIVEDDDEVTVSHGPAQLGYPMASEAMVNIRHTIAKALDDKVISDDMASLFLKTAKKTFYKDRNYGFVIRECIESGAAKESSFSRFSIWMQSGAVNRKKLDALELMDVLCDLNEVIPTPDFEFQDTTVWHRSNV